MDPTNVAKSQYVNVWKILLSSREFPYTPPPDVDLMWTHYQKGHMDDRALCDQACMVIRKDPLPLSGTQWSIHTNILMHKLNNEGRHDEARMWLVIKARRFPRDHEAFYNHGVILVTQLQNMKFSGAQSAMLPSLDGSPLVVSMEKYTGLFCKAAVSQYKRSITENPTGMAGYINLGGVLERTEPEGWLEEYREVYTLAVRHGLWYDAWQHPPHFVPSLASRPWHEPRKFALCLALEQAYPTIRKEYDAYLERLENRKEWDDADKTPGLSTVGGRAGAVHDGGLAKSGKWMEVPLFANQVQVKEYAEYFPETLRILQQSCGDATGLALSGGGDVIFSVITPGTRLRPHTGPTNARLTCHLGIHVPWRQEKLWVRCANETRGWEEGKCIVFDDSYEHEVAYEDPGLDAQGCLAKPRVVLLANFWHPDFAFKNDPDWQEKSTCEQMKGMQAEDLPKTQIMKVV
eukprot:gnl/MRDRNA2_/MRDRNA2_78610_c0_seq1.p1 gnl/MRDRNA2_/MRDRNA2_78610_c0~~gnl/MRDRNA2_/MRDRNA2_78610_c0_seq1.p1  ORF type:complete len:524 (+),score=94.95 gnl/MRDRNA2_/MRDRNA2_78610_c0_seq1:190-1572(+)